MFVFEYDNISYHDLMQGLAAALGVGIQDGRINYPKHVADGFAQMIDMQGNLQAMMFSYTFNDEFRFKRKKIKEEYYTLWFTEVFPKGDVNVDIDNDRYQSHDTSFSTALLTSSLFDANYELASGTSARGVNILLDNQWLTHYLGVDSNSGLLQKYLSLKASRITVEPLDVEYKKLIQEIIEQANGESQFKQIAIQNRVMLLIERFFMRMAVKMESSKTDIRLSPEDIRRVMEVESLITKDVFNPAPFIPELAKMVNISETKLKNNFKTVYGVPIYQYFQKARMRAARDVLESHKYSIKQVALEMGYTNLSNFSAAFRKEFGILPSQLNQG